MKLKQSYYQKMLQTHKLEPKYLKRIIHSFVFGGSICLMAQIIFEISNQFFSADISTKIMLGIIISAGVIASGLGVYDKLGQYAYAGSIIPISGFANSVSASAMEYRPEGIILGIGANIFKLAGTVIVYGIVGTIFFGFIRILVGLV